MTTDRNITFRSEAWKSAECEAEDQPATMSASPVAVVEPVSELAVAEPVVLPKPVVEHNVDSALAAYLRAGRSDRGGVSCRVRWGWRW